MPPCHLVQFKEYVTQDKTYPQISLLVASNASPVNTLYGNNQEARHHALCTVLLTKAPCCTGMSK